MTPSLTSLADHVILPPRPCPHVTGYPCPLPLPVTRCSCPGSLPVPPPPRPCHCRPQTATSLPLPLPTPSLVADDVNRYCGCGKDRSGVISDLRVKKHMNNVDCCYDDVGKSAIVISRKTPLPERADNLCYGCVNTRSGDFSNNYERLSCCCDGVSNPCQCHSLHGRCPGLTCRDGSPSDRADAIPHGNGVGVSNLCGCVTNQRHHPLANNNKPCQISGAHSDSRGVVINFNINNNNNVPEKANGFYYDCIPSNSLADTIRGGGCLNSHKCSDSLDDLGDQDSDVNPLASASHSRDDDDVLPSHLHRRHTTTRDRLDNNIITNNNNNNNHCVNDSVLNYSDRREPCGCDSAAVLARRLSGSVRILRSTTGRDSGDSLAGRPHLRDSVTGTARLTVEWCRACASLPAALVLWLLLLLLLPPRRKGRRREVIQVPHVLLILCLLLTHCLASPWIEESAHSVKLRAQFCQPVPEEHLRSMMGTAFDPERMSSDDPFSQGGKRSDPSLDPRMEDAALDSYYDAGDDAQSGRGGNEAFVGDPGKDHEDEEREDSWMNEEIRRRKAGREVVKKEDIMEEEEEERQLYPKADRDRGYDPNQPPKDTPYPDHSYLNMKRRKREAASVGSSGSGGDDISSGSASETGDPDLSPRDKKSRDPLLHLRLLLSGRNRKLRRKLKKEFRKKARKLGRKPPPWTCAISKVWGRLKEGFFPRYLLDGRCLTDKCFYRLYDCVPQRYRIKLLKRDPDYCNPLPALGANSTYEQKWSVVRYYVTVGCNCEAADPLKMPLPFQGQIRRS